MDSTSQMRYDKVKLLVDRNMGELLKSKTLDDLRLDLLQRIEKFKNIVKRDFDLDADEALLIDVQNYESSRLRYNLYYIIHCRSRIDDINWIIKNRIKFSKFNVDQIFKLVQLKEMLINNAKPNQHTLANDKTIFKYDIGDEIQTYDGKWDEIVGYCIVAGEPRYVVEVEKFGWLDLNEIKSANPLLIKGNISKKGNSFRLPSSIGRKKQQLLLTSGSDSERLSVLLNSVKVKTENYTSRWRIE